MSRVIYLKVRMTLDGSVPAQEVVDDMFYQFDHETILDYEVVGYEGVDKE